MSSKIASCLRPQNTLTVSDILARYPDRGGQVVTRLGPSPTGFVHIGTVYTGLISMLYAHQYRGKFLLRIEDTDQARNTTDHGSRSGGIYNILDVMQTFGLNSDEGARYSSDRDIVQIGSHGPYIQSERLDIYHAMARYLVETGRAYLCFLTSEELDKIRSSQQISKVATGVYASYSIYRETSEDDVCAMLDEGRSFAIRMKAPAQPGDRVKYTDIAKGEIETEDNYIDEVLIKSDGFPSYHLAHIVDDYLMGVSHVIRTDERLPSTPKHIQIYHLFDDIYTRPIRQYAQMSPVMKQDGSSRRKLSKRKDPEVNVEYLVQKGYPIQAMLRYLLSIADTGFENRYLQNLDTDISQFEINLSRGSSAGAMLDISKMSHMCAEYIDHIDIETIYDEFLHWISDIYIPHEIAISDIIDQQKDKIARYISDPQNKDYIIQILLIDRVDHKKSFNTYIDMIKYIVPMIADIYDTTISIKSNLIKEKLSHLNINISTLLSDYIAYIYDIWGDMPYKLNISRDTRFAQLQAFGARYGFGSNQEVKSGNAKYKIGDLAMLLRIYIYSSTSTPDIYEMMRVLGHTELERRLSS